MSEENTYVVGDLAGGVFVDTYVHKLDPKKRLTVPSDWREVVGLPKCCVVMPGVNERCLCAYPAREMKQRLEKLRNISIADQKGRQVARIIASRSNLVPWDAQGRIRVSDDLLSFAGLTEEVVLVGAFECFELWSPERWKEQQESVTQSNLGEALRSVGF